ncbi:MAG: hypothetical protein AAF211_25760, partial [Myxococcota bacterium]
MGVVFASTGLARPPTVDALLTRSTSPVVTGSLDPATEELRLRIRGALAFEGDPGLHRHGGRWRYDLDAAWLTLPEGRHDVTVFAKDPEGAWLTDTTQHEVVVDRTPPPAPTVTALRTPHPRPALVGHFSPAETVQLTVTVAGRRFTPRHRALSVDPGTRRWTLDLARAGLSLASGHHEVTAVATDLAGWRTPDRTRVELVVARDGDNDGVPYEIERRYGSRDDRVDTDGDGLSDAEEIRWWGTHPGQRDTDRDGLPDGEEARLQTDPGLDDTDGDGLPDGLEVRSRRTDPTRADTDGDGLADGDEDLDADGRTAAGRETDPTRADTDGDGLPDGAEYVFSSHPLWPDTDGGGQPDGAEVVEGRDPTDPHDDPVDADQDGLADPDEPALGTSPAHADSDGDGILDGDEVRSG